MKKMMDGAMAPKKSTEHYEAHAKSMHTRMGKKPSKGGGHAVHSTRKGLPNSAKMPNPKMGAGKGTGGY